MLYEHFWQVSVYSSMKSEIYYVVLFPDSIKVPMDPIQYQEICDFLLHKSTQIILTAKG